MNVFKSGVKLSGSIVIAAIISFFLCISINIICSAIFTADIGYNVYVYADESGEKLIDEYQYLYTDNDGDGKDDGQDLKSDEYVDQGYTVNKIKIRSSLSGVGKWIFLVSTQILSLVMLIAFTANSVYTGGFKDANLVRIGHIKKDALKGLKIGFIGNIPFFLLFVLTVVMAMGLAPKFYTVWYAFLNSHYYAFIIGIVKDATAVSQLGITQYILLFALQLIVPIISAVAYILGFKEINLSEKIIYKKVGK